jgi:DNA-binding beta-propeller fold protein YncE
MMHRHLIPALAAGLLFALAGCGGSSELQKETGPVWPPPPDEARVKYVRTYASDEEFSSGLSDVMKALGGRGPTMHLSSPFDVCTDSAGRIFITDVSAGIFRIDPVKREMINISRTSRIGLMKTRGICWGGGKLFIGLVDAGRVGAFTPDGELINWFGEVGQFPNPLDVAYDAGRRRVIIVDNKLHTVFVYAENGDSLFTVGKRGEAEGEFNFPQSVAVDQGGNLYVVDAFNFRVEVFDATGKFLRTFGKQGNVYGSFMRPKGIALDSRGNIYVLDAIHQNFQIFNPAGELLLFVGKFSPDNDGFQNPVSIWIDRNDAIYVTDQLNQRLQVFQLLNAE